MAISWITTALEDTWREPWEEAFLPEITGLQTTGLEVDNTPGVFTAAVVDRIDLVLIIANVAAVHTSATKAIRS